MRYLWKMSDTTVRLDTRTKIVDAAARLLQQSGPAAVTTRGVAQAAGVQAPTIYRLFGDKDGLLDAVAEHVMATYVTAKEAVVEAASAEGIDPLVDLRDGWRSQIEFGIANPDLFRLLSDPNRVVHSPAAESGRKVLEARVHRLAEQGGLRVSEERAVSLIQAAGTGAIQTLLATPVTDRDDGLAGAMWEAVERQILTDAPPRADGGALPAMVAFRAIATDVPALTATERMLLGEWLDRAIAAASAPWSR